MHVLAAVLGSALVLFVVVDALMTTIFPGTGGGPGTRFLTAVVWRGLLRLRGRAARRVLPYAGGSMLLVTVFWWVLTLWLGWTLIFTSDPTAVIASQTRLPADTLEAAYFAGFTIFTLGIGDFVPSGDGWRLVTALASYLGLFLVTLAITYLVSAVAAAVTRRSFAASLHLFGDDPADVVRRAWTGSEVSTTVLSQMASLGPQLMKISQQHFAYPALHFFHSSSREASAPLAVARLEEAILILRLGLTPSARPERAITDPLDRAIDQYLSTVPGERYGSGDEAPPPPDLAGLREAGIPCVDDEVFARAVADAADRRTAVLHLVTSSGRTWHP